VVVMQPEGWSTAV